MLSVAKFRHITDSRSRITSLAVVCVHVGDYPPFYQPSCPSLIRPSMAPRPQSWVKDYEVDFDPSFPDDNIPSGHNSPHERQRMLAEEARQPTRPVHALENPPIASSSTHNSRTSHSRPGSTSMGVPQHPSQDLLFERPRSTGPEAGSSSRMPSYKSVTSSPLNPSFPSGSPPSHALSPIVSPFARPGSRGSAHITRIPSEESRALALGSPLTMNSTSSRGSMILYRRADTMDDVLLLPPTLPHANRSSMISISGDSFVSLSSDSKYPAGMMTPERGLVAYAYDPSMDENEPLDEEDNLHDPDGKVVKVPGRPMSWRGFKNLSALVLLVGALLALFVIYPVVAFYHDNGRNSLIVGNTRINATGQASAVDFDKRSQLPLVSLFGLIDPVTPREALKRTSSDGVVYDLVFSDEFNTDDRTFSKDADPVWETLNDHSHNSRHTTTRNGYLILQSYPMRSNSRSTRQYVSDVLRQRSPLCLTGGFVEISAKVPWSHTNQRNFWTGTWDVVDSDDVPTVPEKGSSLSETVSLRLSIGSVELSTHPQQQPSWFTSGPFEMAVDYVRYYQKAGLPARTCDENGDSDA
ncbi:hypothetical protein D9615_009276 [Tricholomella constricta]|uniref:Uncharacterized protein n=1 Tax=Tricholomella constricta TaxID=117010 RepID=A0A8H5GWE5_9AGAR|nr:hypothetical protein D9615_009276 [Tricholomella constricta]